MVGNNYDTDDAESRPLMNISDEIRVSVTAETTKYFHNSLWKYVYINSIIILSDEVIHKDVEVNFPLGWMIVGWALCMSESERVYMCIGLSSPPI